MEKMAVIHFDMVKMYVYGTIILIDLNKKRDSFKLGTNVL